MSSSNSIRAIRREVWSYWKKSGRHDLPWRKTTDPYKILVSEVMLQQTQVPRVIEKYKEFLKAFPNVRALANARLSSVLKVWSGLGYNRRGKYLHDAAKKIVAQYEGDLKQALQHPLPGVGPYTRAAVGVFAFNEPHTMIETNIRTVFFHHFSDLSPEKYHAESLVSDKELASAIEAAAKGQDPRTWHWALMDYGAHLKRSGVRNNSLSRHYTKQSKFEGSLRQVRGAILRELQRGPSLGESSLGKTLTFQQERIERALAGLERDGLIKREKGKWRIA
jgi:A/G-specific adenine glycosylase